MVKTNDLSLFHIFENTTSLMRNMMTLSDQARRVFEGRSNGVYAKRNSKRWLRKSALDTAFEPLINQGLKRWRDFIWECPEFIIDQLELVSKECLMGDSNFHELINSTKDVHKILKNSSVSLNNDEKKIVIDLAKVYFEFAKKFVSWFERDLLIKLSNEGYICRDFNVSETNFLRYKKIVFLAYLLGYAGICFVNLCVPVHSIKQKKWCLICFRRAMLRSKYCAVHDSANANKAQFRAGEKIYSVLVKQHPLIIKLWAKHRRQIIEIEGLSNEENDTFSTVNYNWRKVLINWVNRNPVLAKRLSVKEIDSFNNWTDAVKFLRNKFSNQQERSFHIFVVRSWLEMALDWFEIEDKFISFSSGTVRRKSKSPLSSIPTEIQIVHICENTPGIRKSEIAKILSVSQQSVGQMISRSTLLHKYFPK